MLLALGALASVGGPAGKAAAVVLCITAGPDADFNGDGLRDTVIADPEATVGGRARAGQVTVVYGGGSGSDVFSAASAWSTDPQAGAQFGFSLAQADLNGDGCSDLVVGAPYTDVGTQSDAGAVFVLYGARPGVGKAALAEKYDQSQDRVPGSEEAGDVCGYSVAAQRPSPGAPYLAFGCPGEDLSATRDAGAVVYVSGSTFGWVDQDSPNVAGVAEADDRFGSSLATTPAHLVVGAPGEVVKDQAGLADGAVWIFGDTLDTTGRPNPLSAPNQESPPVGVAENGDRYGTSLAAAAMPDTSGTYKGGSYLVVGSPGESLGDVPDAGSASVYKVTAGGVATPVLGGLHQLLAGSPELPDRADHFGQRLAAVVRGTTLWVAAGVPGEEPPDAYPDQGAVQVFSLPAGGTMTDVLLTPGAGIAAGPAGRMYTGTALAATPDTLLVGVAYGTGGPGAVYGFDWTVPAGGAPKAVYAPGAGGLPAGGTAWGAEIR